MHWWDSEAGPGAYTLKNHIQLAAPYQRLSCGTDQSISGRYISSSSGSTGDTGIVAMMGDARALILE